MKRLIKKQSNSYEKSYNEMIKRMKDQKVFYHGTSSNLIEDIKRNGFRAGSFSTPSYKEAKDYAFSRTSDRVISDFAHGQDKFIYPIVLHIDVEGYFQEDSGELGWAGDDENDRFEYKQIYLGDGTARNDEKVAPEYIIKYDHFDSDQEWFKYLEKTVDYYSKLTQGYYYQYKDKILESHQRYLKHFGLA